MWHGQQYYPPQQYPQQYGYGQQQGQQYYYPPQQAATPKAAPQQASPAQAPPAAKAWAEPAATLDSEEEEEESKFVFRVWNFLDNHDEHKSIKRLARLEHFERLVTEMLPPEEKQKQRLNSMAMAKSYAGPHLDLDSPLQLDAVVSLMDHFQKGTKLHYLYAHRLLVEAKKILLSRESLQEIQIVDKITVVGDLHGQYKDLVSLVNLNGLPTHKNAYLFNGDFVDRGHMGCEVVFTLLAFLVRAPTSIYLNRGNHECLKMNQMYNFQAEVLEKYDDGLFNLFQEVFNLLPLAGVLNKRIIVLHGGLFKQGGITLAHIKRIHRGKEPGVGAAGASLEDSLMEAILWSDPRTANGVSPSGRGAGWEFGPDITQRFLKENGLGMLIRSHECVDDGYLFQHNGKLLTVFSASNYCGNSWNQGAYAVVSKDLEVSVYQFMSDDLNDVPPQEQRTKVLIEAIVDKVSLLICDHRLDLLFYYESHVSTKGHGVVSTVQWAEGIRDVLELDVDWLRLRPYLVEEEEGGMIRYVDFLERHRLEVDVDHMTSWASTAVDTVKDKLYSQCNSVEEAFHMFDKSNAGVIFYDEFIIALKQMNLDLTDDQLFAFMRSVDADKDNYISLSEFRERFQLVFESGSDDDWARDIVLSVGRKMREQGVDGEKAFSAFDSDGNKQISYDEFMAAAKNFGVELSPLEADRVMKFIDLDGNGTVDYEEFASAFRVVDRHEVAWERDVIEQMHNVLYRHKDQLLHICALFDKDRTGKISEKEFGTVLVSLNLLLSYPLTKTQAQLLTGEAVNHDGVVEYRNLLESFRPPESPRTTEFSSHFSQ